jgi:hypothetical protein
MDALLLPNQGLRPRAVLGAIDSNKLRTDTNIFRKPDPNSIMDGLLLPNQGLRPRSVFIAIDSNTVQTDRNVLPQKPDPKRFTFASSTKVARASPANKPPVVTPPAVDEEDLPVPAEGRKWEAMQQELDDLFVKQSKERMCGVPLIDMPNILEQNGVSLFDHQKDGIRWLVHKEVTNQDVPPFYKKKKFGSKVHWRCTITSLILKEDPEPLKHSILADE